MLYYHPPLTETIAVIVERFLQKHEQEQRGLNYYWLAMGAPVLTFNMPRGVAHIGVLESENKQYHLFDRGVSKDSFDTLLSEIEGLRSAASGEHAATPIALDRARKLIEEVRQILTDIPAAELDSYYGELGIEWQNGNRILRLTSFDDPNIPIRLDYGTMSVDTPGEYKSDSVADAKILAERLVWLANDDTKTLTA